MSERVGSACAKEKWALDVYNSFANLVMAKSWHAIGNKRWKGEQVRELYESLKRTEEAEGRELKYDLTGFRKKHSRVAKAWSDSWNLYNTVPVAPPFLNFLLS